jgi:hypothetical protein
MEGTMAEVAAPVESQQACLEVCGVAAGWVVAEMEAVMAALMAEAGLAVGGQVVEDWEVVAQAVAAVEEA